MFNNDLMMLLLDDSSSDDEMLTLAAIEEEEEDNGSKIRKKGSIHGHRIIFRDRETGHRTLFNDYFSENPTYPAKTFRRRFRMSRPLFLRILSSVEQYDTYFVQKRNAVRKLGLSALQKVTAALRLLAYGEPADAIDEYIRIAESTAIESLGKFVKAVIACFSEEYLRAPTTEDVARLLSVAENRGLPGMLGSIDCMHWRWKNCPTSWKDMYTGHVHEPTMILEAVASYDLWIWHAFFGLPGSLNDINVLDRSPVFEDIANGRSVPCNYVVNNHSYSMGYYLADGIYPNWATLIKSISKPRGLKEKHWAAVQESARKDVERAFGVLQSRFAIVRGPARFWSTEVLKDIMKACVILHNMIIEDERDTGAMDFEYDMNNHAEPEPASLDRTPELMEFINRHIQIRSRETHSQLQEDLMEHQWCLRGSRE